MELLEGDQREVMSSLGGYQRLSCITPIRQAPRLTRLRIRDNGYFSITSFTRWLP